MGEWLSTKEVAQLEGISDRAVREKASCGEYKTRKVSRQGNRYGVRIEIALESLSLQAQLRWLGLQENASRIDDETLSQLAGCPDWAIERALQRHDVIVRMREIKARKSKTGKVAAIEALAMEIGESRATLERWWRAYQAEGFLGLVPRWGKNRGKIFIDEGLKEFLKAEYLRPEQPLPAIVYRRAKRYCAKNGIDLPSYATVLRFLRTIPVAVQEYYRVGKASWQKKFEPKVRRSFDDLEVNEIWVGDHREFDVIVFTDEQKRTCRRPWITMWQDLRSRRIVGWHISFQPSSYTIALALRHGILQVGIPRRVYVDNGKDYRSHYIGGREKNHGRIGFNKETQGLLTALEIEAIFATAYHPWAKPIERTFRNFTFEFEREMRGWCGRDNKERPAKLNQEIRNGELLTFDEFKEQIANKIIEYNHTEHGETGRAPIELYENYRATMVSERALDILLMKKARKKLWADGIHILGGRYCSEELLEKIFVGELVDVYYDPNDAAKVFVFHNNNYICEAYLERDYTMHATEKELRRAARRRKIARERVRKYAEEWDIATSTKRAVKVVKAVGGNIEESEPVVETPARVLQLVLPQDFQAKEMGEKQKAGKSEKIKQDDERWISNFLEQVRARRDNTDEEDDEWMRKFLEELRKTERGAEQEGDSRLSLSL